MSVFMEREIAERKWEGKGRHTKREVVVVVRSQEAM